MTIVLDEINYFCVRLPLNYLLFNMVLTVTVLSFITHIYTFVQTIAMGSPWYALIVQTFKLVEQACGI